MPDSHAGQLPLVCYRPRWPLQLEVWTHHSVLCSGCSVCALCAGQVEAAAKLIDKLSIDAVDEEGNPEPFSSEDVANPALQRHFEVLEVGMSGWRL